MPTAKEFFDLWTRDRQLREPGPRHHLKRRPSRGANRTKRIYAFRAIRAQARKMENLQSPIINLQ